MNTLAKEIFKPKLFSDQHERFEKEYPGFHQMIYDSMEEYAKAYAPVPSNEDYEGAGKILYPLELQQIILDYKAWLESMIPHVKKSIHPQIIEKIKSLDKYKFAAPVPEKEESYWQRRCEAAELIIGISGTVDCEGYEQWETLKEQEPASPSTSNEDELTIEDYKEVFEDHKKLVRELDVIINGENAAKQASLCDLVSQLRNPEPKAVQQAAKEYVFKNNDFIGVPESKLFEAFIAGASFNKDAVEFAEWIGDYENPFMKREDGRWIQAAGNSTSWTTQELYNLYKSK